MRKKLKKLFLLSGIVFSALVVVLVISFLFLYFNKSFVKKYVEKTLAKSGIHLSIGKLDYGLFPLNVQADSVNVVQEISGMEVEVFFSELNLKGQLGRLIRKKRPYLEFLNVKGATFRILVKEVSEEEIDYQMYMRQISDALSHLAELNLENFSLEYITPSNSAALEGCDLVLLDSEKDGEYVYSLSSEKMGVDSPPDAFLMETEFRLSGKFSLRGKPYFEGDMRLHPSKFEFKGETLQLPEIALKLKGEFPYEKKMIAVPQLELSIPSLLDASASLNLERGEVSSIVSSVQIYLKDLNQAYALCSPYLDSFIPPQIESFAVQGSVYLKGEYQSVGTPSEKKTDLKGMMRIEPSQIRCETPALAFSSTVSGEFNVSGPIPDMRLSGSLDVKEGRLSRDDLSIQEVSLGLSVNGTNSAVEVSRFNGILEGFSFVAEDKKLELDKIGFDGQGRIDITGKKANLDRLVFQFPPLAPVEINAFVDLQPQGEKSVRFKSTELDSSELLNLFSAFIPKSVLDVGPMGQFDFDIRAIQSPEVAEEWDLSGSIGLSGGGFHNASFTFASEALEQEVVFKGKYNLSKQLVEFTANVNLSQGESLWNAYYVDWSQSPFQMKMSGAYHLLQKKLVDFTAETALFSEGKIDVRGEMSFQDASLIDLSVTATQLDLGSMFVFASQGTPIEEYALDLGGDAEAQVNVRMQNNDLSMEGRFWIKDASVINQEKNLLIDGIQVDIPFHYVSLAGNGGAQDPVMQDGYLSIERFETSALSLRPFRLDLHAGKNRFVIEPLKLDVFGGIAELGRSVLTIDPQLPSINGLLSFSLRDLDLSKLPIQSDQITLSGTVRLDLPRVELNPDEILTEGKAEVEMFDTTILIEDIKATKPFTKNRTIFCNVRFNDLNLEQLTNTIPFGKVTGILKGEIKDLAISYGQPERFILSLESVKTKGVPQKFSLGAVNDLSIISSGESSAIASNKGFTKFVSEFGYTKIGIFCSLKNDSFTLRGTIKEKGVEYLVKRSWLFGISVVNKKPNNRIRFKDMMGRLERIGQSEGATTQKKDL